MFGLGKCEKDFSKILLGIGSRFPIGGEGNGWHYKDVEPEKIRKIILSEDE